MSEIPTIKIDQGWTDTAQLAARLAALETRFAAEKATNERLTEQLRVIEAGKVATPTDAETTSQNQEAIRCMLKTFNRDNEQRFAPWKTVVGDIDRHKAAVVECMDQERGEGWVSTINMIAAMVTKGDIQPREMLLMATMVPGVTQAERNAALYYMARPSLYTQWLRSHNIAWLRRACISLDMDQGARVTAPYPYMPLQSLSEKVAEVNRTVEGWAATRLRESQTEAVQGGGVPGLLTYAELEERHTSRNVRGGAPFLPHVVTSEGATVTEAAQVAEALQSMQQQIDQLQQQLHRTPDNGVQQRLDAIQKLLLAQQPRKHWSQGTWQQAQPARRTRVRGAGAEEDSGEGEQPGNQ